MDTENNRFLQGTLFRGIGSFYYAFTADGTEYTLRCKKKFRHMHMSPLVGDEILFTPGEGEENGWIEEILPRTTECLRPPVANVTLLMVTLAPVPEPDMLLIDRLLVRAHMQGLKCVLVVTKGDVDSDLAQRLREQYAPADIPVYSTCAATGQGLEELRQVMQGETVCFAGQSGVGKSTLINALLGVTLETGEISQKIQRGKNTTRRAELLRQDGFRVLDTAGFSLLELDGKTDPVVLKEHYPEFFPYEGNCRFAPCYHDHEPGCAVIAACEEGHIHPLRLERYRLLLNEMKQAWRNRYD